MSTDEKITEDLIQTLEDGANGFSSAADKLESDGRPDLAVHFRTFSAERSTFGDELQVLAATYGDEVERSGSIAAAVHRGWMAVKDTIAGSDPDGVLDAALQGEDHAVSEFQKALDSDISPELRVVVARQSASVQAVRDQVDKLKADLS